MRTLLLLSLVLATLTLAAPATASPAAGPAARLVLERTGGFAGIRTTFIVDRTTRNGSQVLRLAGTAQFRRLASSYQPANPCCDRFSYRLTAYYPFRHGGVKTVTTVQGARAPQILWDVIAKVQQVGARPQPVRT